MSQYIWVKKNGDVVKTEEKGKGRTRKDSFKGKDGNWYICVDGGIPPQVQNSEENENNINEDMENSVAEVISRHAKVYREKGKVVFRDFIGSIFVGDEDFLETEDSFLLRRVIVAKQMDLINLKYNAVYTKMLIDKRNNSLYVWRLNPEGEPDFVIENLFIFETAN